MKTSELRNLIREEVRRVLKEANTRSPKPGSTIDDWELVDKKIIKPQDEDSWLELLSDYPDGWINSKSRKAQVIAMANDFLTKRKYSWKVADALDQNEEGEVTWKIA